VSQKKQSRGAGASGGKSTYKRSALWRGHGRGTRPLFIGLMAGIGAAIVLAMYLLESSSLLARSDAQAEAAGMLRISEFMSQNVGSLITDSGEVPDWVEVENVGGEPVDLSRCGLLLQSNINEIYSFPTMTLNPGEQALVYADGGSDADSAPFKLNASGGDTLVLLDGNGSVIDSVAMPELQADASYCRTGADSWSVSHTPTPGAANVASDQTVDAAPEIRIHSGALRISEAMSGNTLYFADEDGEYHDYIEIQNASEESVNIGGWYLSDSSDKLKRWAFPEMELPAGGYLTVHCSGKNRTDDSGHLHTNFKLGRDGETIYLTGPDGHTVDMAETPALENNQAYSRVNGEWTVNHAPTPGLANDAAGAAQLARQRNAVNTTGVYINEIMASPTQQNNDWIEIHNSTAERVDISGWGVSDDASKPRKFQFPQGSYIEPGQYMGVFFSGTPVQSINGFLNADFSLGMEGGYTVSLSLADGSVIDSAYVPEQYAGSSYGRLESQGDFYYFMTGTPGTANGPKSYLGKASAPEYSVRGGFFNTGDSFYVELSAPAGSQIYYTLDCSDPEKSGTLYTGGISVTENTIIRTIVYRDGYLPSYSDTQSYLFDVNNEGTAYVVSLVSDYDNLISDERGIMVKGPNAYDHYPFGAMGEGANFWMDWERDAHVELYTGDGTQVLSQGCGLKLHGQYARAIPVKSFKVIARSRMGKNRFEYPIFSHRDYTEYQSFLLRASGQDYDKIFMRDSLLQTLMRDTSVMYQENEIAICYLNGEYYSMYYMRERINTHSICQHEGWEGMEDDIDLIKANSRVMQGSNAHFEELLNWLKTHDVTTQEAYDYVDSKIDIQNYIEYMSIQIFIGNGDTLNVKRYRNPKTDGKWRWALFDLDWAFTVNTDSIRRWLDPEGMGTGKRTDTTLFVSCMKNPIFRDRFLTYFGQRMGTDFTAENIVNMAEERYYVIDGLLPEYQAKWGFTTSDYSKAMREFLSFVNDRPDEEHLLKYFRDALYLSNEDMYKYFGDWIAIVQASK